MNEYINKYDNEGNGSNLQKRQFITNAFEFFIVLPENM